MEEMSACDNIDRISSSPFHPLTSIFKGKEQSNTRMKEHLENNYQI